MSHYILRKSPTETFFFRSVIPKDLLPVFGGKSCFTLSLKNGIRKESVNLTHTLNSIVQSIYQEIRMGKLKSLTVDQIKAILKREVEKSKRHSNYYSYIGIDRSDKKKIEKGLKTLETDQIELKKKKKKDFDDEVVKLLTSQDYEVVRNSIPFRTLRENLIGIKNQTIKRKREMLLGERKPELNFVDELFNESDGIFDSSRKSEILQKSKNKSITSPKLSKVRDEFLNERLMSGRSPKSTQELKSTIKDLIEIIGDLQLEEVSHDHGREFKRVIQRLPKHRSQDKKYREKSISEILIMKGVKGQETKNLNKLIYRVRIFFKWLKNNYGDYVPKNYFEGLTIPITNVETPRDHFTKTELIKIFDPHNYLKSTINNRLKTIKLPYYWVPLIGLFTGMRLDEICQLRVEDIFKDGSYDVIKVDNTGETKTKNIQSVRIIPIHPTLKKLGFVDYVEELSRKNKDRVFGELKKTRDGYGRNVGRWFNSSYLKKLQIYETQNKVFHSLRHTFITNLLQNGVREEIVNGLDGHKQKTMSTTIYLKGGFGSKVLYKDGISKLRYEGIDFKSLRVDWKKLMHGREQNKKVKMWEGGNLY